MMRIIAGSYGGRVLAAPKGGETTRPTGARVRESLMSTIESARGGFADAVVLDAFAGSGALGIEALSRGARSAVLCDQDREALNACRKNALLAAPESVSVVRADVTRGVPRCDAGPYDVVFLDPPYALSAQDVLGVVRQIIASGQLADGAFVAYEHAQALDDASLEAFAGLGLAPFRHKAYGKKTVIDVFRKEQQ